FGEKQRGKDEGGHHTVQEEVVPFNGRADRAGDHRLDHGPSADGCVRRARWLHRLLHRYETHLSSNSRRMRSPSAFNSGAGRRVGASTNPALLMGLPAMSRAPARTTMLRAWACGWASASATF